MSIWVAAFGIFMCVLLSISIFIYKVRSFDRRSASLKTVSFSIALFNWLFSKTIWELIRLQFMQYNALHSRFISSKTSEQYSFEDTFVPDNFLILIFAFIQCGIVIRMYGNEIRTQLVRSVNAKPFQDNELLRVLKERKYKLILQSKSRWWYRVIT